MARIAAALCAGMLLACAAQAQESPLTLGAGLHYSSGDYGTGSTTRITSLAATARYDSGPWTYRATVPYLRVDGDTSVIPGVGPVRGGAGSSTESGLGDIVLGATYAAYYDAASMFGVDLTGKVKLPTADENKGLGTGEADFAFLVDFYRTFDRVTGFAGIGYHILGDAPGLPLDNVWSANLGASYRIDERDSAGLSLDGRERVAPGSARQRELTAFFTRKLDRFWKAQAYALIGLADGSPDWGFGLSAARPF
jgi:outer membrane putative beta-barrel porin/alpha-amylase